MYRYLKGLIENYKCGGSEKVRFDAVVLKNNIWYVQLEDVSAM